jgi:hypothetical protein
VITGDVKLSVCASVPRLVGLDFSVPRSAMRPALFLGVAFGWVSTLWADPASDLARIHREAIGGRARIEALKAMRATGYVEAGGKRVRFTLIAARPNRLRLETEQGGRTLVQGTDGNSPAWEFDTGSWPPQYRSMAENVAKTFTADAEFDDPLVGGAERGFTFDHAGTLEVEGKKLLRILVTRNLTESFSLLLDEDTFFIVMRVDHRTTIGGRKAQVVTHYEDFRPVDGVLVPHQVTVAVEGRVSQRTTVAKIEANPSVTDDTFQRPKAASVK